MLVRFFHNGGRAAKATHEVRPQGVIASKM
jgi:hypothetical protein